MAAERRQCYPLRTAGWSTLGRDYQAASLLQGEFNRLVFKVQCVPQLSECVCHILSFCPALSDCYTLFTFQCPGGVRGTSSWSPWRTPSWPGWTRSARSPGPVGTSTSQIRLIHHDACFISTSQICLNLKETSLIQYDG